MLLGPMRTKEVWTPNKFLLKDSELGLLSLGGKKCFGRHTSLAGFAQYGSISSISCKTYVHTMVTGSLLRSKKYVYVSVESAFLCHAILEQRHQASAFLIHGGDWLVSRGS